MKNKLFALSFLCCHFAFAAEPSVSPAREESAPLQVFSEDASAAVNLLMNPQLSECMASFKDQVRFVNRITKQKLASRHYEYRVEGMATSGDVMIGEVTLLISETLEDTGWGWASKLECQIEQGRKR